MAKPCTFFSMLFVAVLFSGPAHALRAVEFVVDEALVRPSTGFDAPQPTASDFPTFFRAIGLADRGDGLPPPLLVRAAATGGAPDRLPAASSPPALFPGDLLGGARLAAPGSGPSPSGAAMAATALAVCALVARRRLGTH